MLYQISVIIPFSRPELWKRIERQIAKIVYPNSCFEVIVVLNAVGDWRPVSSLSNLKIIFEAKLGPSYARNAGIRAAKFKHQIFLDDDCVFGAAILQNYVEVWKKYPMATVVGGKVIATLTKQAVVEKKIVTDFLSRFDWCFGYLNYGEKAMTVGFSQPLFSANMSIVQPKIKTYFFSEQVGKVMFNQLFLGEDCLLIYKLLCQGKKVVYSPTLEVKNIVQSSRFNSAYIAKRSVLAGAERWIIDGELLRYNQWDSYLSKISFAAKRLILGDRTEMRDLISQPNVGWFVLGYILLGPILHLANALQQPPTSKSLFIIF